MHWYKRDPDAFIAGTIELTLEEIGAYTLFLTLFMGATISSLTMFI